MRYENDGLVAAAGLLSLLLVGLSLWNLSFWFAIVMSLLLIVLLASGYGRFRRATRYSLAALLAAYLALFVTTFATDQPFGGLTLLGGLPRSTAVLVYGIWPLGLLLGVLYFREFRASILPGHRLEKFLDRSRRT